jgi:TonB family protein
MRLLVTVVLAVACGPGVPDSRLEYRSPKVRDFAGELSSATRRHDVVAIRSLLRDHVTTGGLWFEDVTCMTKFAAPARVSGPGLDELARCLSTLELAPSARVDALPDVAIVTYGPGLELQARLLETEDGAWLNWIGFVARRDLQDALPTVSAAALEALRVEGDPHAPPNDAGTFAELATIKAAYAWLKVCIDSAGTVTGAHVREASSPKAARAFAAAAQTWKFQPFVLRSQPTPVCAMVQMRYPNDGTPFREMLPLPLPATAAVLTNVPSRVLGNPLDGFNIPSPYTDPRAEAALRKRGGLTAAVHYCIDEAGRVTYAALIRSTGLERYDQKIVGGVRSWRFRPYLDEGNPVAVCSSIHFSFRSNRGGTGGPMSFGSDRR